MPWSLSKALRNTLIWYRRVLPGLALIYLIMAIGALVATGVTTWQWMNQPFLGVLIEPTGYVSSVGPAQKEAWVGKRLGLTFPDRLKRLEHQDLTSITQLNRILRRLQPGDWVTLVVQRADGSTEVVLLPLQRFPMADRWMYFFLPALVGLVYLGSGLWVYFVRQWDAAGRLFVIATASAAFVLVGLLDALGAHYWTSLWSLALGITGGSLLAFALHFPQRSPWLQRWPWLQGIPMAVGSGLGLWGALSVRWWHRPWAYVWAWRAEFAFLGLSIVAFLVGNLVQRLRAKSPLAREQAGLVLASAALSFGPLLGWMVAALLGWPHPFSPWLVLPLMFFPLGVAYTLLRYRTINVDHLLEQGAIYAILAAFVSLSYALIAAGLSEFLGLRWKVNRPWLIGLLSFLVALGLEPARRWVQDLADQVFAHRRRQYRLRLSSFGQELIRAVNEAAIWSLLRDYIATDLAARPIHLFVQDPLSGDYRSAQDLEGNTTSDVRFAPQSGFIRFLAQVKHAYYFGAEEQIPEAWRADLARVALLQAVLFVPLPGQEGQLLGFLALGPRRDALFLAADVDYLEGLARQAALALERARTATLLARRVDQLNTLTRVAQGVNATPTLDDLLELVVAQTQHLVPFSWIQITLWDPQREHYSHAIVVRKGERVPEREQRPLREDQGLIWWVLREQRTQRTDDYEQACRVLGVTPEERGILAWMGVPLVSKEGVIGAIAVGHHAFDVRYTEEHAELLQAMADLAAGAIVKAHLLRQSDQRARQLALLNEMGRTITGTLDLRTLQERLLESARRLLNCAAARLWLQDPASGSWEVAAQKDPEALFGDDSAEQAWVLQAVEQQRPLCWPPQRDEAAQKVDSGPPLAQARTVLAVPLLTQDRAIGVLVVADKIDGSRFTEDEGQLLLALAGQAAVAIENARLYAQTDQALAARVEELSAMELIDRELNASLDLTQAMRITLEWALRRTHSHAGLIGLVREEERIVQIIAEKGFGAVVDPYRHAGLPLAWPGLQQALLSASIQRLSDVEGPGDFALLSQSRAQLVVPILREGRMIGVLLLESPDPGAYRAEEVEFLARLVEHAAIAIANAQLYEAVQEANRAKSEFVSFVAHELKTPMTAIRGYADLLRSGVVGPLNDNQRNFLDVIRANVERMAALVSDLADISRIEAGQLRLNFQRVAVPKAVEEVVRSLGPQIEAKGQHLILEVPEDLPDVWADPIRLVQILTNLVSNAHKYTPEGGTIRIKAALSANEWDPDGPPQVIHIAVEDTGLGIHPEEQSRIFQRFFRSENDRDAKEQPGTGLGLYITKNLVEMQGGKIWFESEYRQGTTFHFTVPVATAEQMAPQDDEAQSEVREG